MLARVLQESRGRQDLALLLQYVLQTTPVKPTDVRQLIEGHLGEAGKEAYMLTGAEQLVEQGRAEGRTEGRTECRAELLLLLLGNRFGPLDAPTQERIRTASFAQLEQWAVRMLTAPTLVDVLR